MYLQQHVGFHKIIEIDIWNRHAFTLITGKDDTE